MTNVILTEAQIEAACRDLCAKHGIPPDDPAWVCWSGGLYALKDITPVRPGRQPRPGYELGASWMRYWNFVDPVPPYVAPVPLPDIELAPTLIKEAPAEHEPEPEAAPVPVADFRQELDALKAVVAQQAAELARLREAPSFPSMNEKVLDHGESNLTLDQLTEDVIAGLTKAKRKKFTELLNVELAELQQEREGPRENLPREAEIEKLLGLFARVGEM